MTPDERIAAMQTVYGMWGKDGSRLIPLLEQLKHLARPAIEQPIKGQIDMFGKEVGKDEG